MQEPVNQNRPAAVASDRAGGLRLVFSAICSAPLLFGILLCAMFVSDVSFSGTISKLREEMASSATASAAKASVLASKIAEQDKLIRRFNTTTTNTDLLHRVEGLEKHLDAATAKVELDLQKTEKSIQKELSTTLKQLDTTVFKAQTEIKAEVASVKTDVDTYVAHTNEQFSSENSFMLYQLSGTLMLIGGLISLWHMTSHLRHFHQPFIQRKVLAILWMAPIYSVTSWLSLVFSPAAGYLSLIKDMYEAYAIYTFFAFLIAVLGKGNRNAVVALLAQHSEHLQEPIGLCCYPKEKYDSPYQLSLAVINQCQFFCMQFVLLKPFVGTAKLVLVELHVGDEMNYRSPQLYLTIIENISIFVAFYGLLKFYHAIQDELQWCNPWPKFLTIKGVVFLTFWQGLTISILYGIVSKDDRISSTTGSERNFQQDAQNFLITIEMLIASLAHFYVFPHEEWAPGYKPAKKDDEQKFGETLALRDFVSDLKLLIGSKKKKKKFLDEHWGDAETPDSEPANRQDRAASEDSEESEGVPAIGSGDLDDEDLEKVAESLQKLEQKLSYKNVAETDDMELYEEEEKKPAFMDEEKTYSSFV